MVESEEELKRLLMKVKKGEWKGWLKTQHSKNNIIASGPNHSWHISLFQFSLSAVSDSATPWTAVRQASLSITAPGAHSNSCPLSRWCHPTISFSVIPFSSCLQSLPASGSLQMSQYWSVSFNISPYNEYSGPISFRMDWLDLLASQVLSRIFSNTTVQKHQFFGA